MALEGERYFSNISDFFESTVKNVTVMHYTSKKMSIPVNLRRQSTFMHVLRGAYHYKSESVDFYVNAGDTVYVPCGASYVYSIETGVSECLQVEFDLCGKDGKLELSDKPFVHVGDGTRLEAIFRMMLNEYRENSFGVAAEIYTLLSLFEADKRSEAKKKSGEYKIVPAVRYIKEHFKDRIYVSQLAELCGFSEPHLRRLFAAYLGQTPTEYKDSLLSSAACDMLKKSELNISEVAYELKFSDVYTFSQFFKRLNGVSPRRFAEMHRNKNI